MTVEPETVAVFECGYREPSPPDPEDITPNDPNGLMYRKGDHGHDYCYLRRDCPGCGGEEHLPIYPYADQVLRIIIQK